ncbi:MAG: response regulator [Proteobacteria bacterium]|nr:response regulator [Pseudomonadota bacterium]
MATTTRAYKLLVLLVILCVLFVAGDYFIRFHIVLPGFAELERQEAIKDITRCSSSIKRELRHVEKLGTDWAVWDDLYQYAVDGNEPFVTSNFQWDTLAKTGIHLMYVINTDGKIVYSGTILPSSGEMINLEQLPAENFPKDHRLLKFPDNTGSFAGIFLTGNGPLLLSSHKILTSVGEGPSHGTLLLGRFLDTQVIKVLQQQTQVEFTIRDPLTAPFSDAERQRVKDLAAGKQITEIVDNHTLLTFGLLADLQEQPAILITATLPRHIVARGRDTARISSVVVLVAVGLIILAGITLTLILVVKSRRRQEEIEALVELRTDQLRISQERLHALSDASFEAIFLTAEGICLEQNKAAETMFGYSSAEAVGRLASAWIAPEDRALINRKAREKEELPYEIKALRKDGQIFPALIQTREAEYRGRKILVSALRDLTLQKQAEQERQLIEEKLRRAQKMESIGMMAGGVAHDLNNILSGVITYPELILLSLPKDSPLVKPIKAIRESGKSAAAVVEDLLTLARGVSSSRVNSNINIILAEYAESPEFHNLKSLQEQVAFRIEKDPHLLNITCSPIHIKKCIINLITNAAEAIVAKGEVVVSTRNQYCETPLVDHPEMHQGEYAVLSVADNGTGIPKESLERIFEPFFSRKVIGRSGTGLGLAVIWNTVQDHKGGITVKSGKDGTTFELYFPATRDDLEILPDSIDIKEYQGKGEKILVVDDDGGQRSIATQILSRLNYRNHAVESGEEALLYLSTEKADLVILDMIMSPGMNGCQTFNKILEMHPRQKAIITSGYSESKDVQEALSLGVRKFLKKPYLVETLAMILKDTLENS